MLKGGEEFLFKTGIEAMKSSWAAINVAAKLAIPGLLQTTNSRIIHLC